MAAGKDRHFLDGLKMKRKDDIRPPKTARAIVLRDGDIGLATAEQLCSAWPYYEYRGFQSARLHRPMYDGGHVADTEHAWRNRYEGIVFIGEEQWRVLQEEMFKLRKQAELLDTTLRTIYFTAKRAYVDIPSRMNDKQTNPCTTK